MREGERRSPSTLVLPEKGTDGNAHAAVFSLFINAASQVPTVCIVALNRTSWRLYYNELR